MKLNKSKTIEWLNQYKIKNYIINKDLTVSVEGDVDLSNQNLSSIPIKFYMIAGNFNCKGNRLTDLSFCPIAVDGHFDCSSNHLKTLEGGPKVVQFNYNCNQNELISLVGSPNIICGDFNCRINELPNLKNGPQQVLGSYYASHNNLKTLEGVPISIGEDLYICFNELETLKFLPKSLGYNLYYSDKFYYNSHLKEDILFGAFYNEQKVLIMSSDEISYINESLKGSLANLDILKKLEHKIEIRKDPDLSLSYGIKESLKKVEKYVVNHRTKMISIDNDRTQISFEYLLEINVDDNSYYRNSSFKKFKEINVDNNIYYKNSSFKKIKEINDYKEKYKKKLYYK